jgi:hypothetical protein
VGGELRLNISGTMLSACPSSSLPVIGDYRLARNIGGPAQVFGLDQGEERVLHFRPGERPKLQLGARGPVPPYELGGMRHSGTSIQDRDGTSVPCFSKLSGFDTWTAPVCFVREFEGLDGDGLDLVGPIGPAEIPSILR